MSVTRIYPVFIPFSGCPSRCIYCDQSINTLRSPVNQDKVFEEVKHQIVSFKEFVLEKKIPGEIAFYGGTFTALAVNVLERIAEFLYPLCREGIFTSIRCSTRPDALEERAVEILKTLPMNMVELGVQTLDDELLGILRRGYTVETVKEAVGKLRALGWKVGLQLMVGVPGENREIFLENIKRAIALCPDAVRLYPLIVFPGTVLAKWYNKGKFRPISLKEAIIWSAGALVMFEDEGINVIRMGLQSNQALDNRAFLAGPYHPAFGYFVRVHWWRSVVDRELSKMPARGAKIYLDMPKRFENECRGPHQINVKFWIKKWHLKELALNYLDESKAPLRERVYRIGYVLT